MQEPHVRLGWPAPRWRAAIDGSLSIHPVTRDCPLYLVRAAARVTRPRAALHACCRTAFTLDGSAVAGEERIDMQRRIRDLLQARDGALLVLTDAKDGELLRVTPASAKSD